MKRVLGSIALVAAAAACSNDMNPTAPPSSAPSVSPSVSSSSCCGWYKYYAHAAAVRVKVLGLPIDIVDAGPLNGPPGQDYESLLTLYKHGVKASLLNAAVDSKVGDFKTARSLARASLTDVVIYAGLNVIKISLLESKASAGCEDADKGGSTLVKLLVVNGKSIAVGTTPNLTIPLILGSLTVNEQIKKHDGITVNGIHVKVAGIADIILSRAFANLIC